MYIENVYIQKMKKKVNLITGITGQNGSYLAELLLKKKYKAHINIIQ